MRACLRLAQRILLNLLRRLQSIEQNYFGEEPNLNQLSTVVRSTSHNMATEPDEAYYREEYLFQIDQVVGSCSLPSNALWLDLGCGQGRLTVPLANTFPDQQFIGVDISSPALDSATTMAKQHSLSNCAFCHSEIIAFLKNDLPRTPSVVLMNEVTFFFPEWPLAIELIEQKMERGSLLFLSFRPLYYYALMLVKFGLVETAATDLLNKRCGPLFPGSPASLTWLTQAEALETLTKQYRFELIRSTAIGSCSGIPGDPLATICRPAKLNSSQQAALRIVEREIGAALPDCGRYMFLALKHL